jgi:hypothetical protein
MILSVPRYVDTPRGSLVSLIIFMTVRRVR